MGKENNKTSGITTENVTPARPVTIIIAANSPEAKELKRRIEEKAALFYNNSVALTKLNG